MPSRRLVTSATSVIAYSAASSWNASCSMAKYLADGRGKSTRMQKGASEHKPATAEMPSFQEQA